MSALSFASSAAQALRETNDFGEIYTTLKMEFFRQHQHGLVLSTEFSAEFFDNVVAHLTGTPYKPIRMENGQIEIYSANYMKLLEIWRKEN